MVLEAVEYLLLIGPFEIEERIKLGTPIPGNRSQVMEQCAAADPVREKQAVAMMGDRPFRVGLGLSEKPLPDADFGVFHERIIADGRPPVQFSGRSGQAS